MLSMVAVGRGGLGSCACGHKELDLPEVSSEALEGPTHARLVVDEEGGEWSVVSKWKVNGRGWLFAQPSVAIGKTPCNAVTCLTKGRACYVRTLPFLSAPPEATVAPWRKRGADGCGATRGAADRGASRAEATNADEGGAALGVPSSALVEGLDEHVAQPYAQGTLPSLAHAVVDAAPRRRKRRR
jgi:hypothetical protein